MYRCQICKLLSPPCTPAVRVIVEKRRKIYAERFKRLLKSRCKRKPKHIDHETRLHYVVCIDYGGKGWEIVQELTVCPQCRQQHTAGQAEVKKAC